MSSTDKNSPDQSLLELVNSKQGIDRLLSIMAILRDPENGCPWDCQQDYQSIIPFTIEEVYEVVEAIESGDYSGLKEELGDLLFQVVFYSQIGKESGDFDFSSIVDGINSKLIRRHPHVFADAVYQNEQELKQAWEAQKQTEREQKVISKNSVLDNIPKALPELKRAHKIQSRVAKTGFDWDDIDDVWGKVEEETEEVRQAALEDNQTNLEEELGDLLFSLVNLTRWYGVDADIALRKANQKFERRFRRVEASASSALSEHSLEELESLWQSAKKQD